MAPRVRGNPSLILAEGHLAVPFVFSDRLLPVTPPPILLRLSLVLAASLVTTSCAGPFQSVADMTRVAVQADADQIVQATRIDPRFAYLRVQGPAGPAAL